MDQWYQGLGPDERMVLSQLFREMGKEDRGAPEIEMHDRSGRVSVNPTDPQGMKARVFAPATGGGGARTEKAPAIGAPSL